MDIDYTTADLHRKIVEGTSDAVIFADRQGVIRLWNRGAELIFGHPAADALGQSLDIIIPEHLRRAHWNAFDHSVETGQTKYSDRVLTTRSVRSDGTRLYVDLSFGLVKDVDGRAIGAFAIGRDCTARYQAEKTLEVRLQALEADRGAAAT